MVSSLRLAIDAGATKGRFALYADPLRPVLASSCRGLNYTLDGRTGMEDLLGAIRAAISRHGPPAAVGLATAGAGRPDIRSRALHDLEDIRHGIFPGSAFYLFHDGEAALYRALGNGVGIVVAAGTGSIAYGRDADGREARVGGWGHLVGDEGSAYWIAARAIALVLRSFDGREPETALSGAILAELGKSSPQDLVSWVHDPSRTKREIAALSRLVSRCAEEGDEAAARIAADAGRELARAAVAASRRLGFGSSPRVGLAGGVLIGSAPVREAMRAALLAACPRAEVLISPREPEIGAALLLDDALSRRAPDLPPER